MKGLSIADGGVKSEILGLLGMPLQEASFSDPDIIALSQQLPETSIPGLVPCVNGFYRTGEWGEILAYLGYAEHIFPYSYSTDPISLKPHIGRHPEWHAHLIEGLEQNLSRDQAKLSLVLGQRNENSFLSAYQNLQRSTLDIIKYKRGIGFLNRTHLFVLNPTERKIYMRTKETSELDPDKSKLLYPDKIIYEDTFPIEALYDLMARNRYMTSAIKIQTGDVGRSQSVGSGEVFRAIHKGKKTE